MRIGLSLRSRLAARSGDRLLQLAQLVIEIRERSVDVQVLEVDRGRAPLQLAGVEKRRQVLRDVMEDARAFLLRALDLLPVRTHPPRRRGLDVAEDVRMATDKLCLYQPRNFRKVTLPPLFQQPREGVDLEQQIAE